MAIMNGLVWVIMDITLAVNVSNDKNKNDQSLFNPSLIVTGYKFKSK